MKVKGTGSICVLEECVKDNYYARFQRKAPQHELLTDGQTES